MKQTNSRDLKNIILADRSELPYNYYVKDTSIEIDTYKNKMNF